MTVAGLPLHALVVHATVVLIPISALLSIGFAVLPRWRWLARWPSAAGAVLSIALAYLTTASGQSLEKARPELAQLVRVHADRGHLLAQLTIVFAVVVVAAALLLPGPSGLASGKGAVESRVVIADKVLPLLVVLVAVVVLVQVVLTGDAGARAVWG
jgi:hypothetical protein